MRSFLALYVLLSVSSLAFPQSPKIDWSKPAQSLQELENQLRAWQTDYNATVKPDTSPQMIQDVLKMNLERGYLTAKAFMNLRDTWENDISANDKQQKYAAITAKFCDWNGEPTNPVWQWYDSFGSPLGLASPSPALAKITPSVDHDPETRFQTYFRDTLTKRQQQALTASVWQLLAAFFHDHGYDVSSQNAEEHLLLFAKGWGHLSNITFNYDTQAAPQELSDAVEGIQKEFSF
jgi:hypothetical protein